MRGTAMPAPQGSSIPNAPSLYSTCESQNQGELRELPRTWAAELLREAQRLRVLLEAAGQELARQRQLSTELCHQLAEKNRELQQQLAAIEQEIAQLRQENHALRTALQDQFNDPHTNGVPDPQRRLPTKLRCVAIIPARNEDHTIAPCIESLAQQTYPLEKIIVVNDGSTDWTEFVVNHLRQKYPQVECLNKQPDGSMRAGAINYALKRLFESNYDLVLIADADATYAPTLVEEAVKQFEQDANEEIGGICSAVELVGEGLLHRLQKLEYGGFNADRAATWRNIMIIHGLCGVYRLKALRQVRGYTVGHLIEDYDLTVRLKKAGWKAVFNPGMHAKTHSVPTLRALIRQRLRWYRGGVQVLLDHGINRFTALDAFNHIHFLLLLMVVGLIVGFGVQAAGGRWTPHPWWHPIPIAVLVVGWIGGLVQLRWVKGLDWKDVLLRLAIIPELLYYTLLSLVRLWAYLLEFVSAKKRW
ncbi:MAG: glycosyltransferase [Candidatus Bipolaricaulota bacterium]|nr:glycosyltransferase [Candidatus Bipolaricaulota bacterium]MDW8031069.1 glycosyltransferase [Candidatus Bipolaricaulota bacterium]